MNDTHLQPCGVHQTRVWPISFSFLLLALVLGGCSKESSPAPASSGQQKIVIKGSNTIGEEMAPQLIDEYRKAHAGIPIELETKGSASGFWGLIAGVCDIAAASRQPIQDEAQQAKVRGLELKDHLIGFYSIAIVVHPNNPVQNLTRDQVRDIYTGKVQNWKEVGGPDQAIHIYGRDPISGTYLGFRELALQDSPYAETLKTSTNYSGIEEAVGGDPHGIGYSRIGFAGKGSAKLVSIDGVKPTVETVRDGKYPYVRRLYFYTRSTGESSATRDFVEFVKSKRGQEIVAQTGNVPAL